MKNLWSLISLLVFADSLMAQNVGIGTNTPNAGALFHVYSDNLNKAFLVSGWNDQTASLPFFGSGSRMIYHPGKAIFRAGFVTSTQWVNDNSGFASMATGYNTIASGNNSSALGENSVASGQGSTAMGMHSVASGGGSTAMGIESNASGLGSAAIGNNTTASNAFSTAMGSYTVAKAIGGMSIGIWNDESDNPNTQLLPSDRIFQIGNGSANAGRSNAVTVLRSGNTGIGILDPAYRLDLAGRMRIRSGGTGSASAGIWLNKIDNSGLLGFVGVDGNNDIGIYSNTSGWSFVVDDATGNVTVKGTVKANGVTLTSDERLKKDITPLDEAMPLLEKLNGYQYHWKDASWDASLQTGLLAQEVERVMPELVKTVDKGMKSVNYIGLIPYMLEAAKEQQAVITAQQKQIEELKRLVTELLKK
jgi:hypothetical protein